MAAKMPTARLSLKGYSLILAQNYTRTMGPTVCCNRLCNCPVNVVRRQARQGTRRQIKVPAFFRRIAGTNHGPNCRFNTPNLVRRIVAMAPVVTGTEPMIVALPNGSIQYRLHILMEALRLAGRPTRTPADHEQGAIAGSAYIRSSRVLLPYIRQAKAISALAMRLDDEKELIEYVRIVHDGQSVAWSDFYFGFHDYGRLYDRLRNDLCNHPVAIAVNTPDYFEPYEEGRPCLMKSWFEIVRSGKIEVNVQPRLWTIQRGIAERMKKNECSIVCGIPRLRDIPREELSSNSGNSRRPFAYVNIDVSHYSQVAMYTGDG